MDSLLPGICTVLIHDEVRESQVVTYAATSPGIGNYCDHTVTWETKSKHKLEIVD